MNPLRSAVIALLVAVAGCSVDVEDFAGRRCDDTRGCLAGRVCVSGVCVVRLADGGVPSSEDAGTTDAGSNGAADAGVRWRQTSDGFDRTRELTGTANIAAAAENRLEVQVSAAGSQAVGVEETQLGRSPSGAFAGRILLSTLPSGRLTTVFLESEAGGALVRLSVESNGALLCESTGGTLQPTALGVSSAPGVLTAGATHVIEASFIQGAALRVWVNDVIACDAALGAFTDSSAGPKELRLGIDSYSGSTSVSVTLSDWVYAENARLRLTP